MELITIKRETNKNPKETLLELFNNNKEPFIVMMSDNFFDELRKCPEVKKDSYELNPSDYYAYFINETQSIASKCLLKIEVKYVAGSVIIIKHKRRKFDDSPAQKIYYFE